MNLGHLLEVELPRVSENLDGLGPTGWHLWPYGGLEALVRRLPDGERHVAIVPFIFTWGLVVGTTWLTYDDRWCYHDLLTAVTAAHAWDGEGDPTGWHRHPASGRRRPAGDPALEYMGPLMDANKLEVLREIAYAIRPCCGLCAHGRFESPGDRGTCQAYHYGHRKHTGAGRELSVTRLGCCGSFQPGAESMDALGAFSEFYVG